MRVDLSRLTVVQSIAGVSQGSVHGPILFTTFFSPIGSLPESYDMEYHKYADDIQLCAALKYTPGATLGRLSECILYRSIVVLVKWYTAKPWKVGRGSYGIGHGLRTSVLPTRATVAGCSTKMCDRLEILGVTLNASLTFESHINDVVKSCNFHIRPTRHLRQ